MIHPDDIMERYMGTDASRQEAIEDLLNTTDGFTMITILDSGKGHFKGVLKVTLNDANIIAPAMLTRFRQLYGDVWMAGIREWLDAQNIS